MKKDTCDTMDKWGCGVFMETLIPMMSITPLMGTRMKKGKMKCLMHGEKNV